MSGRNRRTLAPIGLLMAAALTMLAAPVYAFLGEKGIDVSPAVWNIAVAFCRVITGVLGLLAIVSAVTGRRSASSRRDTFGSIAGGVVLIAAAIAGLELVLVITGVVGFGLLCVGGAAAVGPTSAYDSSGRSTTQLSGAATKREPRPYGPARCAGNRDADWVDPGRRRLPRVLQTSRRSTHRATKTPRPGLGRR